MVLSYVCERVLCVWGVVRVVHGCECAVWFRGGVVAGFLVSLVVGVV